MANLAHFIYEAARDDIQENLCVVYDDDTGKVLYKDSDISNETDKVKALHALVFGE